VHEQREAVDRPRRRRGGAGHRLGMGSRDHVDATLLELGPEGGKLLLVELVLVRICLEDLLLELSELLRLVDESPGCQFSKLGQFRSLLYFSTSLKKGRRGGRRISYNACFRADIPTTEPGATS